MNMNRIISILYLLLFFTGEGELYAWNYPTSKPSKHTFRLVHPKPQITPPSPCRVNTTSA